MFIPGREELAWAAGFFDGEGTTVINKRTRKRWPGDTRTGCPSDAITYSSPSLGIRQAGDLGREVLEKFQRAVGGLGSIGGPYAHATKNPLWRDCYAYTVNGHRGVQAVIAMLWPFLGSVKKKQAATVLSTYLAHGPHNRKGRTFPREVS